MVLSVIGLHQIAAEEVVDGWKSAGLWMPPGIALYWRQALGSEEQTDRMHSHLGIDQDMRCIAQNQLSPAIERQWALDEAITKRGQNIRLVVLIASGVIAEYFESPTIQLGKPTLGSDSH